MHDPLPQFDLLLSLQDPKNQRAARARGWYFDRNDGMYRNREHQLVVDPLTGETSGLHDLTLRVGNFW